MTDNEKKELDSLANSLAVIADSFITSAFIMWGWNILASHFNAPSFSYWEVFIMRIGVANFMKIFCQRNYRIKG